MSASYTFLKNSNSEVSTSDNDRRENGVNVNTTIHVNQLCTSNKILVNKAKLSEGIMKKELVQTVPSSEKIYYNPKFLTTHVKTLANIYNKQLAEERNSSDANIHINRNYLVSLNNSKTVNSSMFGGCENSKQSRAAIHINPNFFKQSSTLKYDLAKVTFGNVMPTEMSDTHTKKTEEVVSTTIFNQSKTNIKFGIQAKSKYKLINKVRNSTKKVDNYSTKAVYFKTKYTLKRCNIGKEIKKISDKSLDGFKLTKPSNGKLRLMKRLPSEFKKLGRTKLVRKSVLQSMILARRRSRNSLHRRSPDKIYLIKKSPAKKRSKNLTFFPKGSNLVNKTKYESLQNSSFKRLGKMKIVRKSLLKAQIASRYQVRKQRLRDSRIHKCRIKNYLSKFKLRNAGETREFIVKQRAHLKWIKKKHGSEASSRTKSKKPSRSTPNPKKLKKNNQPCPFYNRFGRCKGKEKGTCPKLHDAKYISICRKLLQGECNAEDCLLSHDIRPGKMPTCHHYLAGLCTRPNCPFLHIKVNPKAPICLAFLQGFCPDVHNCLKRHEFICPKFAEKGSCPRGKSCTYPHRSPIILSKLLKDDQKPLLLRTKRLLDNCEPNDEEVSNAVMKITLESGNSGIGEKKLYLDTNKDTKKCKNKKDFMKEPFTRYFAITEINTTTDEFQENNNEQQLEIKDEFR